MVVNAQRDCAAHRTGRTGSQPQDLTLQLFSERGTGSSAIALDGNCAQSYRELRYRHRTRHRRAWAATEYWHALTGGQHRGRASRPYRCARGQVSTAGSLSIRLVPAGGLMAYGIDQNDMFRLAASYGDRILRGGKPAELPVQAPTRFEMALNLKAAKALGLRVPSGLIVAADEVIE